MYETFYHLREKPFTLLPDPGFLYLSDKHSMALTLLEYSLMNHAGFTVISGEIGAGKTTLIRHVLNHMDREHTVGLISTTHRSFGELLQWILLAYNLDHANLSKVEMYQRFVDFIIDEYAHNRSVILIVDEAQNMPADVLEELRMLSNINADKDQALQVILVGQRELRETLQRPELAQFAQRISVDFHLKPLSEDETVAYIHHRLQVAGGDPDIFEDAACRAVHRYSNGVPRLINLLCDTAMVYGYADQAQRIGADLITTVAQEKQQGGIFPTFEPAADEIASSADATRTDAGNMKVASPESPAARAEASAVPTEEPMDFREKLPEEKSTSSGEHHPAQDAVPHDAAHDSDSMHPGADTHGNTAHATGMAQPLAGDLAHSREHDQSIKQVRVAVSSTHEYLRKYLSTVLKSCGIDVVASVPLDVEHITAMDPENFDVLLIDREENNRELVAGLENIFDHWPEPLLFNDTKAMKIALRQGNYEFGRSLAKRIKALAESAGTRTGT